MLTMTPAHTDSPLRRSEAAVLKEGQSHNVTINDDEEERRQARRRTILSNAGDSACLEENETLKKCLEIYNGNKLSKDNAWSVSLIDTLSTLLDRHHKSLNNFKVAGSSLEASSKVYSLRVDSIHTDVLRMSAGLNAQKFNEKQLRDDDDEDDVATGGEGGNDPNASAAGADGGAAAEKPAPKKQKKKRNLVSTITKNKDTINARLDTVPLQDPVFGKLNSIVGSINSSNRLMNNILLTTDSELRLRTTFPIWDAQPPPVCDYTEEVPLSTENESELAPCDRLFKISNFDDMELRPSHGGYVISDTPIDDANDDKDETQPRRMSLGSDCEDGPPGCSDGGGGGDDIHSFAPFHNANEMGMAFDINAECEPMPALSENVPIMDVNYEELDDDLTIEERNAIHNCRGLRKQPVLIEDLRPVDASSKLEYSYRPLDKISQFWAGPSHWKFKRARPRSTLAGQQHHITEDGAAARNQNPKSRRNRQAIEKKKSKQLNFGEFHDELFVKMDDSYKSRKVNMQKKWDQRKLKLPMDLRLDPLRFSYYTLAPGLPVFVQQDEQETLNASAEATLTPNNEVGPADEGHFNDCADDMPFSDPMGGNDGVGGADMANVSHSSAGLNAENNPQAADGANANDDDNRENLNETVLEIATEYEGAPSQVTKIIVPFAKRAKVIDMKNLKRSCTVLLQKQFKQPVRDEEIPSHPIPKQEQYQSGVGSFHEIYDHLPEILPKAMAESLSTSIAFYSVLHLANEFDLRLIPEEDLKDFKIRKVTG
ncbi:condensin complex subunit 2 [Stomoxys calcitrans]|uniref:Condensin complex subunit 2 n=1 Tax=Stomoxys calcitrans TaxID=35570 RepID=A0A1I8P2T4_STOCA|nr:condensin complex subunit 2 [Stomoxys calcitrans]